MTTGIVRSLFHYPVKGLTAQALDEVALTRQRGFPFDRMFAFARPDSGFDPLRPEPMPKDRFLMLMKDERLAGLKSHFDVESWRLTLTVQGRLVLEADLSQSDGREATEAFFARMFDFATDKMPRFVCADPHRFTDVSVVSSALMNSVSLVNLNSVDDFGRRITAHVDPARFRANIYFDGWPPFSELELLGKEIRIGTTRAIVTLNTRRCAATEVNPRTIRRDIAVPRLLHQHYGHSELGIYAEILEGGTLRSGDVIAWGQV